LTPEDEVPFLGSRAAPLAGVGALIGASFFVGVAPRGRVAAPLFLGKVLFSITSSGFSFLPLLEVLLVADAGASFSLMSFALDLAAIAFFLGVSYFFSFFSGAACFLPPRLMKKSRLL